VPLLPASSCVHLSALVMRTGTECRLECPFCACLVRLSRMRTRKYFLSKRSRKGRNADLHFYSAYLHDVRCDWGVSELTHPTSLPLMLCRVCSGCVSTACIPISWWCFSLFCVCTSSPPPFVLAMQWWCGSLVPFVQCSVHDMSSTYMRCERVVKRSHVWPSVE